MIYGNSPALADRMPAYAQYDHGDIEEIVHRRSMIRFVGGSNEVCSAPGQCAGVNRRAKTSPRDHQLQYEGPTWSQCILRCRYLGSFSPCENEYHIVCAVETAEAKIRL